MTSAMICSRRLRSRLQKEVAGADARGSRQPARGVAGGLQTKLLGRIGIQQIGLQNAVLDDHGAPGGHAFAIEGAAAEAAGDGAVVDHRDVLAGDLLAQFAHQERGFAVDAVAIGGLEDVSSRERATCGSKMMGTRVVFTLRAPRRRSVRRAAVLPDRFGRFQLGQACAPPNTSSRAACCPFSSRAMGTAETEQ